LQIFSQQLTFPKTNEATAKKLGGEQCERRNINEIYFFMVFQFWKYTKSIISNCAPELRVARWGNCYTPNKVKLRNSPQNSNDHLIISEKTYKLWNQNKNLPMMKLKLFY